VRLLPSPGQDLERARLAWRKQAEIPTRTLTIEREITKSLRCGTYLRIGRQFTPRAPLKIAARA